MTTIVYRDGIMAADTASVIHNYRMPETVRKVFHRASDGALIGIIGDRAACHRLVAWAIDDAEDPETQPGGSEATILRVLRDGTISVFEGGGRIDVAPAPFYANGSGLGIAYGALRHGASAVDAIAAAIAYDVWSGGVCYALDHEGRHVAWQS